MNGEGQPVNDPPSATPDAEPPAHVAEPAPVADPVQPLGHEEVGEPRPIRTDRWAHRRAEPRPLAFMWTIYLFIATAMTFAAITGVGGLTLDVYRPALRILLATVGAGVILVWPMIRLSQTPPDEHSAVAALKDFFAIVVPLQAIVWPQWLLAAWPINVIGALSATLTAWAVLASGLLAIFFRHGPSREPHADFAPPTSAPTARTSMMIVFVALAALGPILGAAIDLLGTSGRGSPGPAWWMLASPISAVFEVSRDRFSTGSSAKSLPVHWAAAANVAVVGFVFWFWSVVGRRSAERVPSHPTSA